MLSVRKRATVRCVRPTSVYGLAPVPESRARDESTTPILPTIIARVGEATRLTGYPVRRVPVRDSTMASTEGLYAEGHCWLTAAEMVPLHY
ncbi:hypothetical protein PC129_g19057 [Phytophthora cactorum]|uniref:Uncharacterized protein n=1 Tax=Phytophthora cactorum TaxID=29920 RepID=A0A8T1HD18_9STRA|nr:hypothetical protein Pcac1_g26263 [Phytophthora cactorum]KAG2893446.1 hypothetical protein PC114_g16276 [Phytophthora cactorum]KAG2949845.1 hypothetical protein PC119_g28315 [Phytophthora cactorum]KAG3130861.1 hypothetical protein C6341_g23577 [Phytophthora cactorum]KAG3209939.1 hypothetical protein PC129_g19057 [Phytophthora cactorum]